MGGENPHAEVPPPLPALLLTRRGCFLPTQPFVILGCSKGKGKPSAHPKDAPTCWGLSPAGMGPSSGGGCFMSETVTSKKPVSSSSESPARKSDPQKTPKKIYFTFFDAPGAPLGFAAASGAGGQHRLSPGPAAVTGHQHESGPAGQKGARAPGGGSTNPAQNATRLEEPPHVLAPSREKRKKNSS